MKLPLLTRENQERNDIMTDSEILKLNLQRGKISEKRLVEIFGTPKIQQNYKTNNKFTGTDKKRLLDKAKRFCEIRDDGNRQYYLNKVYDNPRPSNFEKMNKDLYQYICPLILNALINSDEAKSKSKCTMTVGLWAREIKMVNNNYDVLKEADVEKVEDIFGIGKNVYYDFYDRCDEAIDYYIVQALKYLYSAGLIIWREVYFIQPITPVIKQDGIVYKAIRDPKPIPATDDDMKFYAECVKIADKEAGILNAKERYYSKKSYYYRCVLLRELKKKNIKYIFKSYEAYYVNIDRCKAVMNMFDINNILDKFNKALTEKLVDNAEARKLQKKFQSCTDYIGDFLTLCDITINNKSNKEKVKERLDGEKNES